MSVDSDNSTHTDGMDVEEEHGNNFEGKARSVNILAQSEELTVTLLAHLPVEVLQVLRNTDFVSDSFTGDIDTRNSFCSIASVQTCFVWKHSQILPGTPTCYIFPCPNRISEARVPLKALVSYGPSREPGLILLSPFGELRFWDSIGLGLTGGEPTQESLIELTSNEFVTVLEYSDNTHFVAATSEGRLFLVFVNTTEGRFRVEHHPFTLARPQSTMSRLRAGFWSDQLPSYSGKFIRSVATTAHSDEGFEVWTCMDTSIARWSVLTKGWEQLDFEENLAEILFTSILEQFPSVDEEVGIDLELLDLKFNPQKEFVILASYNAEQEEESIIDTRPRRYYIVVRIAREGEKFEVMGIRTVPYQTISSDKANIHPRLKLLSNGALYCVQFGDAVALVARDTDYTNILTLKSIRDRTFGCGTFSDSTEMLFMNSEILMRATLDIEKINSFDVNTWRGNSVKSIMTQAILFGANPKNPLLFTFPPDVDEESLISGAEQLSRAVLASDIEVVRPNPDLTRQILERKDRLRFLISFINENGALGKMSQTSRQRLASDAEKLYSAQQLWALYCQRVNAGHSEQLLVQSVIAYMENSDEGHHEDIMRAFFRLQTREIGDLLPYVEHLVQEIIKNPPLFEGNPDVLCRGSEYILCILDSAWAYRDTNLGVYGVVKPMIRPWTSTSSIVEIVLNFFNLVDQTLSKIAPEAEDALTREMRSQLPRLGTAVFRAFQERQEWLESPAAADEMSIESDRRAFREKFQEIRPQVLHTLLRHNLEKHAFKLAEEYRDFRSLVDLCHSSVPIYPPEVNAHYNFIRKFIEKYKEEFADELYQWYIEHAELRCIFAQNDSYRPYIDSFFSRHPYPSVSWVHDLGNGRWRSASCSLLAQSEFTLDLDARHAMLSIGKLAQLVDSEKSSSSTAQSTLDAFHDGLDYISVHKKLIDELRAPLAGSKIRQSLESQVDIITKTIAPSLKAKLYPGFYSELRSCIKSLLQNHALGVEDLIDVLTLKESTLDFVVALQLIQNTKSIPEARRVSAKRTIWRRIYIHDDWASISKTANKTDTQLVERFRKSALYNTIKDEVRRLDLERSTPLQVEDISTSKILLPIQEAVILPSRRELESRWPGHADEQLDALLRDYENEKQRLASLELDPIVHRIKELVVQELADEMDGSEM